jgi:hypothetical protein
MMWIAFELLNLSTVFVDIGEEAARRLAVETGRRNQTVALLNLLRPSLCIELDVIVPFIRRRETAQGSTCN